MTPILGLLLILLITFVGARFFGRGTVIRTPLLSGLVVSGIPYILTGVLLGPKFFNFLNRDIIHNLEPLISMALGWVGLLFGLQLRWRNIRRFPANYLMFTTLQSGVAFLVILFFTGIFFFLLSPPSFHNRVEAVLILAALGAITAPLMIARIMIEYKARGRLTHFIQFISSLDAFWGILLSGLVICVFHPPATVFLHFGWQWISLSIILGMVIGFLFLYLLHLRFMADELFLLAFGLVVFASGVGFYLRISPIFLSMVIGITIAQFPRESERVMRVLAKAEKPAYLFLLVFAGAMWNYRFWEEAMLIVVFLIARYIGKYLGGRFCLKRLDCHLALPGNIGNALLSFGGISLAIAFNFQLFYGGHSGNLVMSATIIGLFVFDEIAAFSTVRMLRKQGEIQ